ncbi:MAG: hypothetical protein R6X02_00660 [Enhygromyxa sp.]
MRLEPGLPGGRFAAIRPLRGHDERALVGPPGLAATELLERVLVELPGTTVAPGRAWELAVCDRDRLLAAVYTQTFNDRIETDVPCLECSKGAQVGFSLAEWIADQQPNEPGRRSRGIAAGPDESCTYTLDDGIRFRLPTGVDQRELVGLEPERARAQLLARCVIVEPDAPRAQTVADLGPEAHAKIEAAIEYLGPTIDDTFTVDCQECGAAREVRFDIQQYLLRALEHERRYLTREIHYLACSYGWSLTEILDLPRDERRAFVELVVVERSARRERSR